MITANELDLETAEAEMNQAARDVAEALMRGLDTKGLLKEYIAARERFLDVEE